MSGHRYYKIVKYKPDDALRTEYADNERDDAIAGLLALREKARADGESPELYRLVLVERSAHAIREYDLTVSDFPERDADTGKS